MHPETISRRTQSVLAKIAKLEMIADFYMVLFDEVQLASEQDIAAMKIDAISSRGSKKDFIDIYFLLKKYSLSELISFFEKNMRIFSIINCTS